MADQSANAPTISLPKGGGALQGMGMGMGFGMANMFANQQQQNNAQTQAAAPEVVRDIHLKAEPTTGADWRRNHV